jgi:hypothetical protein
MTYFVNRSVHRGLAAILVLRGGSGIRAQESWLESKAAHYSVFYQSGFEQDVPRVRAWADSAERLMRSKYGVVPTHYRLSIYLHPAPTAVATVDNARNHCCSDSSDGIKTGTIDMLAPSAPAFKASSAISSLGMRKSSDDYQAKILVSEYIPIGHYEAQRARGAGWEYYSAPNWFVQGLQEFDAIEHSTTGNRDSTAKRLVAWAKSHRAVFSCCAPEIHIGDDYSGGAAFMKFLADEFGEDVHARILRSTAPTFVGALTEATKPYSRAELFARLQAWLAPP